MDCNRPFSTSRMDDLTGSLVAFAKLKGGFNILGKWRRFPTWGPSWLNPIKAVVVGTAFYMFISR